MSGIPLSFFPFPFFPLPFFYSSTFPFVDKTLLDVDEICAAYDSLYELNYFCVESLDISIYCVDLYDASNLYVGSLGFKHCYVNLYYVS